VGDIPTGSAAPYMAAVIYVSTSNVVATGHDSGITLTADPNVTYVAGQLMTMGAPTVTVKPSTTPVSQTYIQGKSGAWLGTILLTAGTAEDVKITRIKIAADASNTNATSSFDSTLGNLTLTSYLSNVKLYDESTGLQVGSTVPTLTSASTYYYADFSGLPLVISKGTTKAIDVKADITNSTGTSKVFVGIYRPTDVAGNGLSSGQSVTIAMDTGIAGQVMTMPGLPRHPLAETIS